MAGETVENEDMPVGGLDLKHGMKTTEFWLAVLLFGVGFYLQIMKEKDLGGYLMALASLVYAPFRALLKFKALQQASKALPLLLVGVLFLGGCSQAGYVRASEIKGLVDAVCERHDKLVRRDDSYKADPIFGEQKRSSDLRSSEILRGTVDEAVAKGQAEDKKNATGDAETTREGGK